MKFEKFLKGVGTHGLIYKRDNGDMWLIAQGVGMKVPYGVTNLLGAGEITEKAKTLVEGLIKADTDYKVTLVRATIPADGKASDVVRVFGDHLSIEVGILNADFGLLEKADYNLAYAEVEDMNEVRYVKYLLVLDHNDEVIGFIEGVDEIYL